ncbi:hypothetical protein RW64_18405 [Geobacter sulfurreducens]|nr:hypothetical protein RW64_18405 [Geobacter sulfurreducens]
MAVTDLRIRIVVDNKGSDGLCEEHGFSAWIEASGHRILFDTGQGKALVPNSAMLGCDLSRVDTLVLSHGHYDHSGGVSHVMRNNPTIRMYCHAGCILPRYSIRPGEALRAISMALDDQEAIIALPGDQIRWVTAPQQILSGIGVSGPIPRIHPLEDTGGPFFLDPDGHHPDLIEDDTALWIETGRGLIIITGCCHSGLINTVEHIRSVSGVERVRGVIGGLHLQNASRERLEATASALRQWNPEFVIPCHCTGDEATAFLRDEVGTMVTPGYAGLAVKLTE